jgi:hypothetical protein
VLFGHVVAYSNPWSKLALKHKTRKQISFPPDRPTTLRLLTEPSRLKAEMVVLRGYAGLTWSDLAVERGDEILGAMQDFLSRHVANPSPTASAETEPEGEIAGISYRIQGAGPPLVLLPLERQSC